MKILVIEDAIEDFELIDIYLQEKTQHTMVNAQTLKQAKDMLQSDKFDFILLDLGLPDSGGSATFMEIEEIADNIPIILLTGLSDQELAMDLLKSGAQDFIVKADITPILLVKSINYAMYRFEMQGKLKESERQLKVSNDNKDKFMSIIAHDLRNPIASFVASSDYLLTCIQDNEYEDFPLLIKEISTSSKNIHNLLENLLEWASSQTDKMEFNPSQIDLEQCLLSNIELIKPQAKSKNISFALNYIGEKSLYADCKMISTILRNLITNAVKFSPDNSKIEIQVDELSRCFKIQVADQGKDINIGEVNKLLDGNGSTSNINFKNEKTSGLGLLLAKELVSFHKGKIWVEKGEKDNTIFIFCISKDFNEQSVC